MLHFFEQLFAATWNRLHRRRGARSEGAALDLGFRVVDGHVTRRQLTIAEAAALLGCSAWTVRQRYLPQGLPHLRASTAGKLIFFREQIIRWILERQGGKQ